MIANSNAANTVWFNTVQGACCIYGVCTQLDVAGCQNIGGEYVGGNCVDAFCESAAPTGACCVSSGCTVNTESACTDLGGTWTEDGECDDCPATCAGDTNGDGTVDVFDLLAVIDDWGTCP